MSVDAKLTKRKQEPLVQKNTPRKVSIKKCPYFRIESFSNVTFILFDFIGDHFFKHLFEEKKIRNVKDTEGMTWKSHK